VVSTGRSICTQSSNCQNLFKQEIPESIGIGSEIHEFPPRSPDLTLLDFFLWDYVKEIVYAEEPTTRENMKNRIREACRSITPAVLHNVKRAFRRRLERYIQQNGRIFEHLIS